MGLQFLNALRQAKDKTGRQITSDFLTLPDASIIPEYYEQIKLPVALDTIDGKLQRQEYPTITALESDVKRMVANAKLFNDKRSVIYEDAERIRKTASNWMVKNNPAYRDPNYVAQATPITENNGSVNGVVGTPTPREVPVRVSFTKKAKSATPAPTPKVESEATKNLLGKSFSAVQEQIMQEMIDYVEPGGEIKIFTPFANLPPRSLTDYYQVIQKPVGLKSIQKRAKGIHGRGDATGVSDFGNWAAFEEEVSYIWKNAREYNEDNSEMYLLANDFERVFKARLAEAKATVEEPHQPTLKLKMSAAPANPPSSSIKIRLGMNTRKESPAPQSARGTPDSRSTPNVIVDAGALERQKAHVSASVNGAVQRPPSTGPTTAARNPFSGSRAASAAVPPLIQQSSGGGGRSSSAGSPPIMTNGVKSESQPGSAVMPPPALTSRLSSGSPHPQAQQQPPPLTHNHSSYTQPSYNPAPSPLGIENKYRPAGKGAKDALLPQLTVQSHPQLHLPKSIVVTIPASNRTTHQSITLSLPSAHHYLQIIPHIPVALSNRPYRIFVSVNGTRAAEAVRPGGIGERDKTRPLFEARLERGTVNRVEVEVLAGKDGGRGTATVVSGTAAKEGVEWERCTIFLHLLK